MDQRLDMIIPLLARVVDVSSDATILLDNDWRIRYANMGVAQAFGYATGELEGQLLAILFPPQLATVYCSRIRECAMIAADGRPSLIQVQRELTGRRKDGSEFPLEGSILKLTMDPQAMFAVILRDVSERKRVEAEYHAADARMRLLIESVQDYAIFMLDPDGYVTSWNIGAEHIKGYRADEIIGRHFSCFYLPEDVGRRRPEQVLQRALADGRYADEGWRVRKDGSRFWAAVVMTAVYDESGRLLGFAKVTRDMSGRKQVEEELQRHIAHLNTLYEISRAILAAQSPAAIAGATIERMRRLVAYQHASVAWFDIDHDIAVILASAGEGADTLAPGLRLPLDAFGEIDVYNTGVPLMIADIAALAEPSSVLLTLQAAGLHTFAGVPLMAQNQLIGSLTVAATLPGALTAADLEIVRQVADQLAVAIQSARLFEQIRAAQERLQSLSRRLMEIQEAERRAIAAELHDEIGPVLTLVKMDLQSMQRLPEAAGLATYLSESIGMVERSLQQVRNLSLDLRPALLDDLGLIAALRWYVDRLKSRAAFTIRFVHDPLETRLPPLLETACFRVVQEALTNVVRHAQAHHVLVELRRSSTALELTVRDDGIGFDVHAAHERAGHGASVGLLSMQERAQIAGGRLYIESVPGHGTEIRMWFPLQAMQTGEIAPRE